MTNTTPASKHVIYFAAGCFWGVEEIFSQIPTVTTTQVGYMGGEVVNPSYEMVCTGKTGHTETVKVIYTSAHVADLIKIFFECHDPTSLNRQGNDLGTQYRSAIFYTENSQQQIAKEMLRTYEQILLKQGKQKIVTEIQDATLHTFYPAETYHQQYLLKNPHGYRCHQNTGITCPLPVNHIK